ncbi:dethiobiotin synthase [Buchnera aphidicola]|uniref:ATP-dependent dethiobiotin synthetase BioD n=1 Tax=Buchnera aphidicola (Aphis gossypii) TaxID=98785 RepID=A0A5J6ZBX2_9GAMM|nr:dethiobiotin synthase [Buchnera aphidicola]QFQ32118.1 dethiobiotin synthase [Buchnera aphidicola (Aphis gossypii)]UPT14644.1 dethiobiotin synthase [Buchnera aphidicola (Aphis gossypii)]
MIKKFFVTGTDTNIGKSTISGILLKKASNFGYVTAGYKPISSGAKKYKDITFKTNEKKYEFINEDSYILKKSSSIYLTYKEINPISFVESAPPNILSLINKRKIKKEHLSLGLKKISLKSNWILIEGAGGWYTPISNKYTFSDWVQEEKLTVILVVGIKLGCINHAILTEKSILSDNLICSGWIANNVFPENKYTSYYIQTLLSYIKSPLLGIVPYLKNINNIDVNKIKIKLPE